MFGDQLALKFDELCWMVFITRFKIEPFNPVGINEVSDNNDFSVYPNPAQGFLP